MHRLGVGIRRKRLTELVAGAMLVMQSIYGLADESLSGADEHRSAGEAFQDGTEDFLSDPGRVGAIAGSIAAGAAFANPIAPLVGNVAGFVIGKSSDFSEEEDHTTGYQRRSIVPAQSNGADGESLGQPEVLALSTEDPEAEVHFPAQPLAVPASAENENGDSEPLLDPEPIEPPTDNGEWALADRPAQVVPYQTDVMSASYANQRRMEAQPALLEQAPCPGSHAVQLRKRVAVTAFPLVKKDDATIGGLQDVQRKLPQRLHKHLADEARVLPLSATDRRLFTSVADAPTQRQPDNSLTRAAELTRAMDVQFVVTGVVRDMGVADAGSWGTSKLRQWGRALGGGDRGRRFVVDLFVYDGLSGALVLDKRFETEGEWGFEPSRRVGFGTHEFDRSDYGANVNEVIAQMANKVSDTVACQPFMAEVQRVDEARIRIASGAESGLRPGDELALYRSQSFMDQRGANPELRDTGHRMVLQQVQPQYASGELPIEGLRMNVQRGDVVVVW